MNAKLRKFGTFLCASPFLVSLFCGALSAQPEGTVFSTSFEQSDTPPYVADALREQKHWGWILNSAPKKEGAMIVVGGADGAPAASGGSQMLRLKSTRTIFDPETNGPYASIVFTDTPLEDELYFSGVTGFLGEITAKTEIISRFYLNNSAKGKSFLGLSFGIWQKDGELRFFYTKAPRGGVIVLGKALAQEGKLYRFEADVNIVEKAYKIRVYDCETNKLLASASNGKFRGDLPVAINFLRLNNASDAVESGDAFVTYYDDLWIGTAPAAKP